MLLKVHYIYFYRNYNSTIFLAKFGIMSQVKFKRLYSVDYGYCVYIEERKVSSELVQRVGELGVGSIVSLSVMGDQHHIMVSLER